MNATSRITPRAGWWMEGYLPILVASLQTELRHLGEYLSTVSKFVEREQAQFRLAIEKEASEHGLTPEEVADFYEAHESDFSKWHDTFPTTIISTVLVGLCSRLEAGLTSVCKELESDSRLRVKVPWKDIDARGVHKCAKHLKVNFGIDLSSHAFWRSMLDLYKVRDCLVHSVGEISLMRSDKDEPQKDEQAKIRGAVERFKSAAISVDDYERLSVTPEFAEHMLSESMAFWKDLEATLCNDAVIGPLHWP